MNFNRIIFNIAVRFCFDSVLIKKTAFSYLPSLAKFREWSRHWPKEPTTFKQFDLFLSECTWFNWWQLRHARCNSTVTVTPSFPSWGWKPHRPGTPSPYFSAVYSVPREWCLTHNRAATHNCWKNAEANAWMIEWMHYQTNLHVADLGHNNHSSGTQSLMFSIIMAASLTTQPAGDLFHYDGCNWHFTQIPLQDWRLLSSSFWECQDLKAHGWTILYKLSSADKSCLIHRCPGGYITSPWEWPTVNDRMTQVYEEVKSLVPSPQGGTILCCHSVTTAPCGNKVRLDFS